MYVQTDVHLTFFYKKIKMLCSGIGDYLRIFGKIITPKTEK